MDRWIRHAWRAFWVGLGASAVLIGQTLTAPSQPAPAPAQIEAIEPGPSLEELLPAPKPRNASRDPVAKTPNT